MAISRANIRQQVTKGPQKKKGARKYKKSINCKNPKVFHNEHIVLVERREVDNDKTMS